MSVIVIQFITLDGIVSDPDGFPAGGPPADLECLLADRTGPPVYTRYRRAAR